MSRVKDIFIEAQNEYGQNFEFAPVGFSLDEYFKQRVNMTSDCCGADMTTLVTTDGPDYSDIGICPNCGDNA
jgi:hypothetical protein